MSTNQQTSNYVGRTSSSYDESYSVAERAEPGLPSASAKKLAKGLGWFSIGLGLAELLAPRAIASISGVSKEAHRFDTTVRSARNRIGHHDIFSTEPDWRSVVACRW